MTRRAGTCRVRGTLTTLGASLLALTALPPPARAFEAPQRLVVTAQGSLPALPLLAPFPSADGRRIVFLSEAPNLVPGDRNGLADVFLLDRDTGTLTRISESFLGEDPDGESFAPVIDPAGRQVAFGSSARNLLLDPSGAIGDFNQTPDVFVRDLETGEIRVLTLVDGGTRGGTVKFLPPAFSGNGAWVGYASVSDDLVDLDRNEVADVFVSELATGSREVLTLTRLGASSFRTANGASVGVVLNEDSCIAAFDSEASNLVPQDRNEARDVFVRDRCANTIERVSVTSGGLEGNRASQAPAISADGRDVVFESRASNFGAGSAGTAGQLYLHDRAAGTTELLSRAPDGSVGNGGSLAPSLSADGRFVAFQSSASNLVEDDGNGVIDVFLLDRADGSIFLLSRDAAGRPGAAPSTAPKITADGTEIVFQSEADLSGDGQSGVVSLFVVRNERALPPPTETPEPTDTPPPSLTATPPSSATPTPGTPTVAASATPTLLPPSATPTGDMTSSPTPGTASPTPDGGTSTPALDTPTPGSSGTPTATGSIPPSVTPKAGGDGCHCRATPAGTTGATARAMASALLPVAWIARRRRRAGRS